MKDWLIKSTHPKTKLLFILFLLVTGTSLIITRKSAIQDFGNYYYGSKLLLEGKFSEEIYNSIYFFNSQIANYGEKTFFENYTPVTPFSALFYTPFCFFKSGVAKNAFNIFSVCLLAISILRYVKHLKIKPNWLILLLPLIFYVPIHNCIFQGQSYLLITSLVIEAFLFSESGKNNLAAICLALTIGLKIYPAFFLLYFLFKKKYRMVLLTCIYLILLNILTLFFIDYHIVMHYYSNILPRLMNNEVIGPYHSVNQSFYSALLHIFSKDELFNPFPILDSPILIPIIESVIVAAIAVYIFYSPPKSNQVQIGITALGLVLINRYNPSYALVLLIPFAISLISDSKINLRAVIILLLLMLSVSLPISKLQSYPAIVQYARLILLSIGFVLSIGFFSLKFNWTYFILIFILLTSFRLMMFPIKSIRYYSIQNSKGILYNSKLQNDSLFLYSTLGQNEQIEMFPIKGALKKDSNLFVQQNQIVFHNQTMTKSNDKKLNPYLYNDSCIVFMSDQNQAISFYKLQIIKIPQH